MMDESWLDDVAALNDEARKVLGVPVDCPPVGSWVRLFRFHPKSEKTLAASPWHQVVGWDDSWGWLSTVCARAGNRMVGRLVDRADPYGYRQRWIRGFSFRVIDKRPARSVCQKCATSIDREHQRELDAQAALDEHLREVRAEGALWAMKTLGITIDQAAS